MVVLKWNIVVIDDSFFIGLKYWCNSLYGFCNLDLVFVLFFSNKNLISRNEVWLD